MNGIEAKLKEGFKNLHTEVVINFLDNQYTIINRKTDEIITDIHMQTGGGVIKNGVNGVNVEDLLFICIQELEAHSVGPFPCKETNEALAHSHQALGWLISRTRNRIARQVEGKELK